jgi:hypothetical protein
MVRLVRVNFADQTSGYPPASPRKSAMTAKHLLPRAVYAATTPDAAMVGYSLARGGRDQHSPHRHRTVLGVGPSTARSEACAYREGAIEIVRRDTSVFWHAAVSA